MLPVIVASKEWWWQYAGKDPMTNPKADLLASGSTPGCTTSAPRETWIEPGTNHAVWITKVRQQQQRYQCKGWANCSTMPTAGADARKATVLMAWKLS